VLISRDPAGCSNTYTCHRKPTGHNTTAFKPFIFLKQHYLIFEKIEKFKIQLIT